MFRFFKCTYTVNTIIFSIICILLFAVNSYSLDRKKLILSIGLSAGPNIYNSDFQELPAYDNCCVGFKDALGFGFGVNAGAEYLVDDEFYYGSLRAGLLLSYTSLSAKFAVTDHFANIIIGNESFEGKVEHILDPSISVVALEPSVICYPLDEIPFGIKAGFQIGTLINKSVNQEERLLYPEGVTFENGRTVRADTSGIIEEASAIYAALTFGARYDLLRFNNFTIVSELQFNYGLNNLVSGTDWTASSIRAGASLQFRFPEKEIVPPKPPKAPPFAPLPSAPRPEGFDLTLKVSLEGRELAQNDSVYIISNETWYTRNYYIIPKFFYSLNDDLKTDLEQMPENIEQAQKFAIQAAVQKFRTEPNTNVTIICSSVEGDNNSAIDKKIDEIYSFFVKNGINTEKIKSEKRIVPKSKIKYKEQYAEKRYIEFKFADGEKLLPIDGEKIIEYRAEPLNFKIKPSAYSGSLSYSFDGYIKYNGKKIFDLPEQGAEYTLTEQNIYAINSQNSTELEIAATIVSTDDRTLTKSLKFNLFPRHKVLKSYENIVSDQNDEEKVSQYILGYFEFDKSEFFAINESAVTAIKKHIKNGNKIEIMPLTDCFGSEGHNRILAGRRLASALKLLGIGESQIEISYQDTGLFDSDTPEGRILSRSVVVRIHTSD